MAIDAHSGRSALGQLSDLGRETFAHWRTHKAARLGAALSYYALFSLGPLLLIVISAAGLFWGEEAVRAQVGREIANLAGPGAAQAVDTMLAGAAKDGQGVLAGAVGLFTLLLGAIGVIGELKDALNTIWDAKPPKRPGVWGFLRNYVVSAGAVLAFAFLLAVSMALGAAISAFGDALFATAGPEVLHMANYAVSFAVLTVLFALMFKFLPDCDVSWRDVWAGAAATALLFTLGKLVIGLYLANQAFASTFGAAASIVVLMVWVYYSAQLLFLGASFTRAFAERQGSRRQN